MLYRGTKPGALYKGAYKPGKLYKGTQLVAGYADVAKAAPASWDGTYDDVVGVAATGKGKQDDAPTPSAPVPLVAAEGALTASGRTGTTPTTVTLPVLRAIPGTDICDTLAYIGGDQWQVTRRVGVTVVDGETVKFTSNSSGTFWNLPPFSSPGIGATGKLPNTLGIEFSRNSNYEFIFTRPTYAGAAEFENVDALNARCVELSATQNPLIIWYALATPTTETVTLGALPSYPVHTALAVSGDYPPDVTATVKVGN